MSYLNQRVLTMHVYPQDSQGRKGHKALQVQLRLPLNFLAIEGLSC